MRYSSSTAVSLAALLSYASALKFTSPTPGSKIDPTRALVISWSLDFTDPSLIDLKITNSDTNAVSIDRTLATDVAAYAGSYTVPANTLPNSGSGYDILAISDGNTIAQVTGLILDGSTDGNGQSDTVAASTTSVGQAPTNVQTASIDSVGLTTLSGIFTGTATTSSPTSTRTGSSFVTSTTSSESSAAVTSAGNTNFANGQTLLGGELVLGAAGVLAGIVALLA